MAAADKAVNKFLGKEKVVVAVEQGVWQRLVNHLAGDEALPADFKPGVFTIAELYIKKFPGPGSAKLNFVKTAEEFSPAE